MTKMKKSPFTAVLLIALALFWTPALVLGLFRYFEWLFGGSTPGGFDLISAVVLTGIFVCGAVAIVALGGWWNGKK